ncbi:MAG: TonB-dependent receptor family protein [Alphaproteobacteria bacterium]
MPTRRLLLTAAAAAAAPLCAHGEETDTAPPGIDRIVVVSSKIEAGMVAGSASYLGPEELKRHSYADINRALRAVPGVNIQPEDGFGLRPNIGLRGTGLDRSSKITLMEDGILIAPAPYAAPAAYYFPHAGRISAVEVIKGAGAIKYGPRTQGGAVNLFSTPVPEETHAFAEAWFGSLESRRAHAFAGTTYRGFGGVDVGALIETFQDENDGFKELDGGGNTGYQIEDYVTKLSFATKPGAAAEHRLGIKAQYSDELSNETYLGLTDADFADNPYRRYRASQLDEMDAEHWMVSADYHLAFNNGFDFTLVGYNTEFARDWFKLDRVDVDGAGPGGAESISSILADPVTFADEFEIIVGEPGFVSADDALLVKHNNREYYARGVQGVLGYGGEFLGATHDVELGVRYHRDEMDRFQWRERFRMDSGTMVRTSVDPGGSDSNRIDSAKALALYVQDRIEWGDLTVTPGLRFETIELRREDFGKSDPQRTGANLKIRTNEVDAVIPGIGVHYRIDEAFAVFGSVHKGFAPPSPGKTNAESEEAVNFEAGARWSEGASGVSAIFFYNDYSNMFGTCTASTGGNCVIGDQFDAGEVDVTGLEFSAYSDLGALLETPFALPVELAYTYSSAEFANSFQSDFDPWGEVIAGDELPYIPHHQLSAGIGIEGKSWGGDLRLVYVDEVRTRAGQGAIPADERIDSYVVADLTVYWNITDNVSLKGTVRNLFDNEYAVARRPAGLRPGLPRVALAGIALEF